MVMCITVFPNKVTPLLCVLTINEDLAKVHCEGSLQIMSCCHSYVDEFQLFLTSLNVISVFSCCQSFCQSQILISSKLANHLSACTSSNIPLLGAAVKDLLLHNPPIPISTTIFRLVREIQLRASISHLLTSLHHQR